MTTIVRFTVAKIAHTYSAAHVLSDGSLLMSNRSEGIEAALDVIDHWTRLVRAGDIRSDLSRWGRDELEFYTAIPAHMVAQVEAPRSEVSAAQKARAAKLAEELLFTSGKRYMYSSWGYDQTNVTWYEIEKVTAKSVRLVEVASQQFDVNPADPQAGGVSIPKPGARRGKPFTRKRQSSEWVRVSEYQIAHNWDGRPRSFTCGA